MKKIFFYSKNKNGSALPYMLVIMFSVSIILVSLIGYVVSQIKYASYQARKEESLQIAEAGIYFYRWYLAHEVEGKTAQQMNDFWNSGSAYGVTTPYEAEYKDPYGAGIGRYRITVTPPEDYSTIVIVESSGWTYKEPSLIRTVRVRFRRPSWSEFMILANDNMRLSSTTEIFGPFHSNGGIRFDGVAHNIVSSSRATYVDPDTGATQPGVWTSWPNEYNTTMGSNVFLAGKDFPVNPQDFNGVVADLALMKQAAQASNTYFNNSGRGRHIILKNDDTFDIRTVSSYNAYSFNITSYSGSWQNFPIPDNGVIFVEDNVWLEGTINSRKVSVAAADLTFGTSPNVFIQHDIHYTNYDGTDVLGIVAEQDVEIIRDSEDDLHLDAAFLAQKGRVGRKYYFNNYKTLISIYGAIVSNQRFGFGYTDGTGYANRNLWYDNNMLYYPPPYFPTGTKYALDLWEEI